MSSLSSALPQIIDITGSQISGSKAVAGTGGFAKVIGNNAQMNVLTGASIYSSESGTHGGVLHFAVAGQTDLIVTDSVINGMIANGRGGLAYFEGTKNYAKVNGATTVLS